MGKRIEGVREDGATERGEVGSSLEAQGGSVEPGQQLGGGGGQPQSKG